MSSIKEFSGEYRWLSNFWLAPVVYQGVIYPSVENAYQAAKTNEYTRISFITCSPGKAKRMGSKLELVEDWETIKFSVMSSLLYQKFHVGSFLATKLLATGNKEIIEGNNWGDTYWGVCNDKGENHLGKLIMKIRSELQPAFVIVQSDD